MKNTFFFFFSFLMLVGAITFTSCTKDEPNPTFPTIQFDADPAFVGADITIEQGTTFKSKIIAAKGSGALTEVAVYEDNALVDKARIKFNGTAAAANPATVGATDANALNWEIEVTAKDHAATHTYRFEVRSVDNLTQSVSYNVTTIDPGTPIDTPLFGVLFNAAGPAGTGGLDLDTGTGTGSSDAASEIRDQGIDLGQPNATNWKQQIAPITGNGVTLRKAVAGTDFNSVTKKEQIATIYTNSGSDLLESAKVSVGDLFVVKRGTQHYLIRIAEVNVVTTDNSDNYKVDIKK